MPGEIFALSKKLPEKMFAFFDRPQTDGPSQQMITSSPPLYYGGVELGIDARDTRRPGGWDGRVEVNFDIQNGLNSSHDTVHLRVAPVLIFHHLMPVSEVLTTNGNESITPHQLKFVSDLKAILNQPDISKPL
ncbi:uncharacterized protein F4822DRAFT_434844 [Hypoxylon trugodes]|uniref:uncharacterized protein n=1 Tax=Hypoxylon trugodes TaxID=326681 RepID=UPI002199567D|nr:uncharacterized protein F4822DRAFT_434844 [Hypoxylon trugodes]KAI1382913.1 hypothetical protein F4822DRAFT_434844 [Hypoxylon trugodes]